jgi:dihydroorotate dehydrogenase
MSAPRPLDLGTTVAGVRLPFAAMNAAGVRATTSAELRELAGSATGAIVLHPTTVHPFVHPSYRSLQNPGAGAIVPLVRELAALGERPVIGSVAGSSAEEYGIAARTLADAGAALVEADLADPWVASTVAPFEDEHDLAELLRRLVGNCPVPVIVKLPDRVPMSWGRLGQVLAEAGVRALVARNEFTVFEKLMLETGGAFDVIVAGGVKSGYDVRRAMAKGAKAVQVGAALRAEGTRVFARLEREMRKARGERG